MFSSNLVHEPEIEFKNLDMKMILKGYDENDNMYEMIIKFISVISFKQTLTRFNLHLYGAYDKIVELFDSDWLKELRKIDSEEFSFWNPKHYVLYLDGYGMYQFIAQSFEVEKMVSYTELSKEISYALRHAPWEYELEMDEEGWVPVEQLLDALHKDKKWKNVSENDLAVMIQKSEKKRHEILNGKIKAHYGHSIQMRIIKEEKMPPGVLYHGTARKFLDSIKVEGLLPKGRQYVHLSQDIETANSVGMRRDRKPCILRIDAKRASKDGIKFYYGNEKVWLADEIPSKYIVEI